MAWQTPKLDWTKNTKVNKSDYNRIIGNVNWLKEKLTELGFPVEDVVVMQANKDYISVPYASEFNQLEKNLEILNANSYLQDIGTTKTFKPNNYVPDQDEYNRIEIALNTLYDRYSYQIANHPEPTIEVTSEYGDYTSNSTYVISGIITATGNNGIGYAKLYWYENGIKKERDLNVNRTNGSFSITVTLNDGTNNFIIKATDEEGYPAFFSFDKKFDNAPPIISITSKIGYITSSAYTLTGKVVDAQSGVASFTINDSEVELEENGTFSVNYTVNSSSTFNLVATDNTGKTSTMAIEVTYDVSPHTATLSQSLVQPTNQRHGRNVRNGYEANQVGTIQTYDKTVTASSGYSSTGYSVTVQAWYSGKVNLSVLPNWQDIKKVVINRYGEGNLTVSISEGQQYVEFSDYNVGTLDDSNATSINHMNGRSTTAGIRGLTYYYIDN